MKTRLLWLSLVCFGIMIHVERSSAADDPRPSLFIAPLEGAPSISGWQPGMGEGLAKMLAAEATRTGKFKILVPTAFGNLLDDVHHGDEDFITSLEKTQRDAWAGVDFMLRGRVTRFGSKERNVDLSGLTPTSVFGDVGVKVTTSEVRIEWRVVDVVSRENVKSGDASESQKGPPFDLGDVSNGSGGGIAFDNLGFMKSPLGKATAKALTDIVHDIGAASLPESNRHLNKAQAQVKTEQPVAPSQNAVQQPQPAQAAIQQAQSPQVAIQSVQPAQDVNPQGSGKVLAVVNQTTLFVSIGSQQGVKEGDKLKLYSTVDATDAQGNLVSREDKLVGEVTLVTVQDDRSKASYVGDPPAKNGWIVKK